MISYTLFSTILDTTCGDLSNDYYYSSEDSTQEPDVTDPKITEIETQLPNNTTTVSPLRCLRLRP